VELDPTTGALINSVGSVGFTINGLTYDASTGTLYGSTGANNGTPSLVAIDMNTGAGTVIGAFGLSGPVVSIASNAAGAVYGWQSRVTTIWFP